MQHTHTNICRMNANCARFVETKWNIGFAGSRSATKWDKLYACFILAEREQNNKKQSRLIPGQAKSKYVFIIYAHTHTEWVSRRKSNGSRVHLVNLLICWLRGIFIAIFSSLSLSADSCQRVWCLFVWINSFRAGRRIGCFIWKQKRINAQNAIIKSALANLFHLIHRRQCVSSCRLHGHRSWENLSSGQKSTRKMGEKCCTHGMEAKRKEKRGSTLKKRNAREKEKWEKPMCENQNGKGEKSNHSNSNMLCWLVHTPRNGMDRFW